MLFTYLQKKVCSHRTVTGHLKIAAILLLLEMVASTTLNRFTGAVDNAG